MKYIPAVFQWLEMLQTGAQTGSTFINLLFDTTYHLDSL